MSGPAEMTTAYVAPGSTVVAQVAPGAGNGTNNPPNVLAVTTAAMNPAAVMVTPTQVRRPWRSTARSAFQFAVALATLLPFIAAGVYQDGDYPVVVGQVLVVASVVTRVMALPGVEKFLQDWAPFLAAAPAAISRKDRKTT